MQITLTVIAGPYSGQTFTFDRPERFLVGRSKKAHFRLQPEKDKDLRVSRMHFLVEVNPPLCRLHDLGSRNGTRVNGQRVTTCGLAHGNEIRAGKTVLRVAIAEAPTALETTPWIKPPDLPPPLPLTPPTVREAGAPPASGSVVPGATCLCCGLQPPEAESPICAECRQSASKQPQPVPGYLLLSELGKGGMGVVYLALRQLDQHPVAVKVIQPAVVAQPGLVGRFLREASILRELQHEHIVAFQDIGEAEGLIWFAMDHVAGSDAARFLKERGLLPIPLASRIILQGLQALEYAHARQFVHRDIKPANILLERSAHRLSVKLADFGLARIYQASRLSGLTLKNETGGTLEFMPPEQITNFRDVQPAADQFSAAATLYTLLTGYFIRDLSGTLSARIDQVLNRDPVPIQKRRADLPENLAAVIHRALERRPQRRYPDVKHFHRALRPFAA